MRKWIAVVFSLALTISLLVAPAPRAATAAGAGSGAGARGVVIDTAGHPLEEAHVEFYRLGAGLQAILTTNGRGEFTLDTPVPEGGLWQLRVAAPGYHSVETGWINLARQRYQPLQVAPLYGAVAVVVRDKAGRPLAGTALLVTAAGQVAAEAALEQGSFERQGLDTGDYRLIIQAPGYASQARTVTVMAGRAVSALVTLEPSGLRFAGEIRDAVTGAAVDLALVELLQGERTPVAAGGVALGGRFVLSLPQGVPGDYRVQVSAPGYRTAVTALAAMAGGQARDWSGGEAIRLQPLTASWAGVVISRYGSALGNTPVVLQRQGYGEVARTSTTTDGQFRFDDVVAGPGLLYRLSADEATDRTDNLWTELSPGVVNQAVLQGRAGNSQIFDNTRLSGLVLSQDGAPLAGVKVELLRGGTVARSGSTGADGSFLITEVPSTQQGWSTGNPYALRFSKDGFLATREFTSGGKSATEVAVPAQTQTAVQAVLRPAAASLSGRVTGVDGAPLSGVVVRLQAEGDRDPSAGGLTAKSDDQGVYRFAGVALKLGARYSLRMKARGFAPVVGLDVTDAATGTGGLPTVALAPAGAAFAGQVLGPDGRPVEGADLILRGRAGEYLAKAASDAAGYYRLDAPAAPAAGLLTLTAAKSGWRPVLVELAQAPAAGATAAVRDLVLIPAVAGLEGRVVDGNGDPVFASIDLVQEGRGVIRTVETNAAGFYQVEDVALEGSAWYWLRATSAGRTLAGSLTHQTELVPMLRLSPGERTVVDLLMN